MTWRDRYDNGGDNYHQIAVIANPASNASAFRYRMTWFDAASNGAAFPPMETDIQLSGLPPGDSVLLELPGYASQGLNIWRATSFLEDGFPNLIPPPQGTAEAIPVSIGAGPPPLSAGTAAVKDMAANVVWLRLVVSATRLANEQGDGVGQALRIRL